MIKPETPVEKLFFVTARLECQKAAEKWSGTGFFVDVPIANGPNQVLLVTNRHVFEDAEQIQIITPAASPTDKTMPMFGQESIVMAQPPAFVTHPDDTVDIAVMDTRGLPFLTTYREFIRTIPINMLVNDAELAELDAIEPITFIGYPDGLHDTVNMTPIARRGWCATPISLDYNGGPTMLIDASVFPGSSGSPVFVVNSGSFVRRGYAGAMLGTRIVLLGIVAEVYVYETTGELVPAVKLPKVSVEQVMDLGIVYKTRSILETIDHFLSSKGLSREIAASVATAAAPVDPPAAALPPPV